MKANRFHAYSPKSDHPQISPFGETYTKAGKCAKCAAPVFVVTDEHRTNDEPDPRGFAGPHHSLATLEEYPDVKFCWDCLNEHGSEGYKACRTIAEVNS